MSTTNTDSDTIDEETHPHIDDTLGIDTGSDEIHDLERDLGISYDDLEITDDGEIDGAGKSIAELEAVAHLVARSYVTHPNRNRLWFRAKWLPIDANSSVLGRSLKRVVDDDGLVRHATSKGNTARYCFPEDLPADSPHVEGVDPR